MLLIDCLLLVVLFTGIIIVAFGLNHFVQQLIKCFK
jgi:hypothetical protein